MTFCGIIFKAHWRTVFFLLFISSFPIARNPRSTSCKSSHREERWEQLLNHTDLSVRSIPRTYWDNSTSSREPRITFLVAHKSYYRRFISRNIARWLSSYGVGKRRAAWNPVVRSNSSSRRRRVDEPISPFSLFQLSRRRSMTIKRHVRLNDHEDISRGYAYMRRGTSRMR